MGGSIGALFPEPGMEPMEARYADFKLVWGKPSEVDGVFFLAGVDREITFTGTAGAWPSILMLLTIRACWVLTGVMCLVGEVAGAMAFCERKREFSPRREWFSPNGFVICE